MQAQAGYLETGAVHVVGNASGYPAQKITESRQQDQAIRYCSLTGDNKQGQQTAQEHILLNNQGEDRTQMIDSPTCMCKQAAVVWMQQHCM